MNLIQTTARMGNKLGMVGVAVALLSAVGRQWVADPSLETLQVVFCIVISSLDRYLTNTL
jgi:hypothetical protein